MLRVAGRPAIAAGEHLAARGDAPDHGMHRVGDRPSQRLGRLVLQIGAIEELLLDALFEHGHGS